MMRIRDRWGALGVLMAIGLFRWMVVVRKSLFYEITSPLFDKVTIHLDNRYYSGKTFQIITKGNSTDNMYIQNASLNGKK